MKATTHDDPTATARLVWGALGVFFAFITARTLLADVRAFAELRSDHLMTIGAMVGAVAAGIYFGPMLKAGKLLTAVGLAIAFTAATVFCLIGSAGRGDELAYKQNADARKVNEDRERYLRDRTEANGRWQAAVDAETAECAGGDGPKCKAKRKTTEQRRSEFEVADILVRQAQPEARENGKLKRAAEIVALVRGGNVAAAEHALALLWPFLPPSICEILSIIFLHQALVPRRRRKVAEQLAATVESAATLPATVAQPLPVVRMSRAQVLELVRAHLADATLPSQCELARQTGVNKGTISKWLRDWECAGLISRTRDGRSNVIALASARPQLQIAR